jgi:hypothetical protein
MIFLVCVLFLHLCFNLKVSLEYCIDIGYIDAVKYLLNATKNQKILEKAFIRSLIAVEFCSNIAFRLSLKSLNV